MSIFKGSKKVDLLRVCEELNIKQDTSSLIGELKQAIESSKTFKDNEQYVRELISEIVEERKCEERENKERLEMQLQIEKLKITRLEKEIELNKTKNEISNEQRFEQIVVPESKVNLETLIKSIRTLSLPVPTRAENFGLFFQSLERAYVTKNVPNDLKTEILINILGEKANTALLYSKDEEIIDYEKFKALILREYQITPKECLNNFNHAQKFQNETYIQFVARLTASFEYYCKLREVNDFNSLCELMIADKLYSSLDGFTATHVSIQMGNSWFKPIKLAQEIDIYCASKGKPVQQTNTHTSKQTENPNRFLNRNKNSYYEKPRSNYKSDFTKCFVCNSNQHFSRACPNRFKDIKKEHAKQNINQIEIKPTKIRDITSELEYIDLIINGENLSCLNDSGARISVINKLYFNEEKSSIKPIDKITLTSCFGESELCNIYLLPVSVKTNSKEKTFIPFAVSKKLSEISVITPSALKLVQGYKTPGDIANTCEKRSLNSEGINKCSLGKKITCAKAESLNKNSSEIIPVSSTHEKFSTNNNDKKNMIINSVDKHFEENIINNSDLCVIGEKEKYISNVIDGMNRDLYIGENKNILCTNDAIDKIDKFVNNDIEVNINGDNNENINPLCKIDLENVYDFVDFNHIHDLKIRNAVMDMVKSYKPNKIKDTNLEMKLILTDENPVTHKIRRFAPCEEQIIESNIRKWMSEGIIQNSCSDYVSPVVLVKKKDGTHRLCIDYRKLNKKIIRDNFPLPLIEQILDKLSEGKIFTAIDLKNGFFHVNVNKDSCKYTAFITSTGMYEFKKTPFGLSNSPAVFQRYIYHVFRDLMNEGVVLIYLDDILIPSANESEGMERLARVLKTASEYGLELNFKKCQFLKRRINFLGHIIENGTISPSTDKTKAVLNFPEPKSVKQVQSYLGLTSYFRKYIENYSIIAKPLSDLTRGTSTFYFGPEQKLAFNSLKEILSKSPVLHLFKQGIKTELHCDASKYGYGAILLQQADDGNLHPVYYLSRKTTSQEEKYSSYELEVLAIIGALKKFRSYLLGNKFKIITDCKAFQQTMGKKELTPKIARWALLLEEFNYEISHRSGKQMKHVDALSRYPVMCISHDNITQKIIALQEKDEYIFKIKDLLSNGKVNDYIVKNNVLYKIEQDRELLVIPQSMQTEIVKNAHLKGHFAVNKTEHLIKQDFYFPNMRKCVESIVTNCIECILVNRKKGKAEGFLNPIPKGDSPLHTYHVDFLGPLPTTNKNYNHILSVIDAFTKFAWLYPVKSTTTQDVLQKLKLQQTVFGNPSRIITDKGPGFTSTEFEEYCKKENIEHRSITTGIPRGNGQVERLHNTLIPVLAKLSIEEPKKWYLYVEAVQRTLNSTITRSTKYSPFELLTGTKMKNKEDQKILNLLEEEQVEMMMEQRKCDRQEAKKNIFKIQEENRKSYNKKRKKAFEYEKGDIVAIQRTQFGTGLKLRPKFHGPYEIIEKKPNDRYDVRKIGHHEGPNITSTAADHMKAWSSDSAS